MNSRSVNEKSLVNFSVDLSTLNTLDSKDGLLSFPFDHLYACSENSDRRQPLELDKEVEITTCVVEDEKELVSPDPEVSRLSAKLSASENQNKRLKDLLIYHLDLIQQQNDHITKREKCFRALKVENDTLKSRLMRVERRVAVNQRQSHNPSPLVHVPSSSVTSTVVKTESGAEQIQFDSLTELILPNHRSDQYVFESDVSDSKNFGKKTFGLPQLSEAVLEPSTSYVQSSDLGSAILEKNINCKNYTMIESKRNVDKKENTTENRPEALYTITSNSGNPIIQRIQRNRKRNTAGIGNISRTSKSAAASDSNNAEDEKTYNRFTINKKPKMINTYSKTRTTNTKRTSKFGSLSERLQLIDTTPTGEDPYQLGEADMREQSPIPKLMLQKSNHTRVKFCTNNAGASLRETNKAQNKLEMDRFDMPNSYVEQQDAKIDIPKTEIIEEPDLDIVKTEAEIDWRIYEPEKDDNNTPSLCDYSYGENPNNLASNMSLDCLDFQDLFPTDNSLGLDNFDVMGNFNEMEDKTANDKAKRRNVRTTSLINSVIPEEEATDSNRDVDSKRGRKRALSTTGLSKAVKRENTPKVLPKPKINRGKAACRGKKLPLPGLVTRKPYHTLVGDPDLSWYLGLDPEVKLEDVDHTGASNASTVEVPRWREKPYTSCYTMEGTENLDDKVYEKRHQKLEAEERRQLRWHMRRVREQRQVERLRQRQRDPWSGGGSPHYAPSTFTIWPQPQRDVRFIEITDTLPVTAFGEILPALPPSDFMLPWVRISKALKRSKRSKTLH